MNSYDFTKDQIDSDRLNTELKTVLGVVYSGFTRDGNNIKVHTLSELTSNQQIAASNAVASHNPIDIDAIILAKIQAAMSFGSGLMAQYGMIRVKRDQASSESSDVKDARTERVIEKLSKVQSSMLSGSLKVALRQLQALEGDADVPQADIDDFIVKIQHFLS